MSRSGSFSYPNAPPQFRQRSNTVGSLPQVIGDKKHVTICLDTSSSMDGNKLSDSLSLLKQLVTSKHPRDTCDVMYFNTSVYRKFFNADKKIDFDKTEGGGTRIEDALHTAFDHLLQLQSNVLLFLLISDGLDDIRNQEKLREKYNKLTKSRPGVIVISFFVLIEETNETETVKFLRDLLRDGFCEVSHRDYQGALNDILKTYQETDKPEVRQKIAGAAVALEEAEKKVAAATIQGNKVLEESEKIEEEINKAKQNISQVEAQVTEVEKNFEEYDGDDTTQIEQSLGKLADSYRTVQVEMETITQKIKQRKQDFLAFNDLIKELERIDKKIEDNTNELDVLLNKAKRKLGITENAQGHNILAQISKVENKRDSLTAFASRMMTTAMNKAKEFKDAIVAAISQKLADFKQSEAMKTLENLRKEIRKFIASEQVDTEQVQRLKTKMEEINKKIALFNDKLDAIKSL